VIWYIEAGLVGSLIGLVIGLYIGYRVEKMWRRIAGVYASEYLKALGHKDYEVKF
jgi:ABC-type lipoprotein release transport system permease subunit